MKYVTVICLFFQVLSLTAFGQAYKYHTVAPEENVYRIAQKYNLSAEDIYKYNPDARNGVDVGSRIVIPLQSEATAESSDVSFRTHRVEKKETLFGLSQKYNVSVDDIKRYNKQLYSKELQQGDDIQIPVYSGGARPAADNNNTAGNTRSDTGNTERSTRSSQSQRETREHIVLPKETKYGIARKYGMTVDELEKLNPKVDVLQPGVMIRVATDVIDEPVIITDDNFDFYEVQPKETIFGLTQKFQVDQDSLMALNPGLKDGLKTGMVLKVPTKDSEGRELEDIDVPVTERAEGELADLENNLKDFSTKNLVVMLPFNLTKVNNDTVSNSREVLQADRVMRISLDFYEGVLMATEKARDLGISTNLQVYDTQQQPGRVSEIIRGNNFSDVDAVIGPLFQATSEEAARLLSDQRIPVISPITNRELRFLPNLYQARPSDEMLSAAMIEFLRENSANKNVIIVADRGRSSVRDRLTEALPNARLVNPSEGNISESSLSNALVKDRENWVVLESESVALLSSVTSALNRQARNNRIRLFTTNKNSSFENTALSNEHLGRLNFTFPSEYKEFDFEKDSEFVETYREKHGVIPNNYTLRGYDLTMDVLLRLGAMGTLEESIKENIITEYLENKFHYSPRSNGGFSNDAVYIVHYNDDLTLSVDN